MGVWVCGCVGYVCIYRYRGVLPKRAAACSRCRVHCPGIPCVCVCGCVCVCVCVYAILAPIVPAYLAYRHKRSVYKEVVVLLYAYKVDTKRPNLHIHSFETDLIFIYTPFISTL